MVFLLHKFQSKSYNFVRDMSSASSHPPLLILSNSVYAKRKDGSYYPGSIVDKHNDCYMVKFLDGGSEQLHEDNLTWLGFWDLPPWSWPKHPVIQPTISPWEQFQGFSTLVRDSTDVEGNGYGLFTKQRVEETLLPKSNQPFATSFTNSGHFQDSQERAYIPTHVLPEKIDSKQSRSDTNVIAICYVVNGINVHSPYLNDSWSLRLPFLIS